MWRHFIATFERSLALTPTCLNKSNKLLQSLNVTWNTPTRSLVIISKLRNTESARPETPTTPETDSEYILPYRPENEKCGSIPSLVEALRTRFRLRPEDVKHVLNDTEVAKSSKKKAMLKTLETLVSEGVTKKSFLEYPWVITLNDRRALEKIQILQSINGLKDINDFVPFLRLSVPRLSKVVAALNKDSKNITHGNRVYYIAEKLDVSAGLVTKYLAKRLFVLEMPLDMFKTNLKHMINYNVEPISILRDLWSFRYHPRSVQLRLQRAKQAKKYKIMPWMVRCPETILQKSLKLSLDELKVLDDKSTVAEYIGERLGFNPEDAQAIMNKHPQVNTVRVTKIKEVLDYLMLEENFSRHEIAQVPRVLCHSLKTTRTRIKELKELNCRPSTLIIVCRSQREYEKFVNAWIYNNNKFKTHEQSGEVKNLKEEDQQR